ncbi:MAG: hypothetical protein DME08_23620, partial [Candidatus Rokuibacteriota bacterium]
MGLLTTFLRTVIFWCAVGPHGARWMVSRSCAGQYAVFVVADSPRRFTRARTSSKTAEHVLFGSRGNLDLIRHDVPCIYSVLACPMR